MEIFSVIEREAVSSRLKAVIPDEKFIRDLEA